MRTDLPPPTRRELDQQRLEFIRWCGASYERLVAAHVDPTPWLAFVVRSLQDYLEPSERAA